MPTPSITRRHFLALGAGGLVLAACSSAGSGASTPSTIGIGDPAIGAAEARRASVAGTVRRFALRAAPMTLQVGSRSVETWGYDGVVPGTPLRVSVGDTLEVVLANDLPEDTTIHWHGLALRNDMDGVHDLTQAPIRPGETFTYSFIVPDPGTYWFHPHMGLQLDRGLYAPLIIEDPNEQGAYDVDQVVVLDDWLDGIGATPESTFQGLTGMSGMGSMDQGGMGGMGGMGSGSSSIGGMSMFQSDLLGGDAGDVSYPLHLINGKPPSDRATITVPPGGRARLRIVNAGSDTAYRVALGGHRMTVTHADGFPVTPVEVDTLLIGMGERYDVIVAPSLGTWPLVALAEGKNASASAIVRTSDVLAGTAPTGPTRPSELDGRILSYRDLVATEKVALAQRDPDVEHNIDLTGTMMPYQWAFDGKPFGEHEPLLIEQGQRVRLTFTNNSAMWHPVHIHGHTFRLGTDATGPRKDTVNVLPGETVTVEFDADNPGQWMVHCHNTYHLEQGMAQVMAYKQSS